MKQQVLNKIVKKMSEKQNSKSKLNAGQLREAVNLFVKSIVELSEEDKLALVKEVNK